MTPDQIKAVQESFAKVVPISEQAAALFYGRLFEIAPAVKPLFRGDMKEQGHKLMATLAVVVGGLSNLQAILPAASALAKRHVGYGVSAADYAPVGEALLWTLERGLGARLDAGTRGGLEHGLRCAVGIHDRRSLRSQRRGRMSAQAISSQRRPRLVVVGNGMAGMRTVEELLARAPDRFDITVIGAEPQPNYNRIMLSSVLAGDKTLDDIVDQPARVVRRARHRADHRSPRRRDRPRRQARDAR